MGTNDKTSQEGYNMTRAKKYANNEEYSYGVRIPNPPRYSRAGGLLLPDIRVKEQPISLDMHSQAPAVLRIVDGSVTKFLTNRFYLTGVQEAREEKTQIIETFGVPSFNFFGEKTRIYNFSGQMLEGKAQTYTKNKYKHKYLWASSFLDLYEKHLRGTKLAENGYEAILTFKNTRLYGFILNVNMIQNASNPLTSQFSFSMIVRKQENILGSGDDGTLEALYSVTQWVKSDTLVKQLAKWNASIGELAADEIQMRNILEETIRKSIERAVAKGAEIDQNSRWYQVDTIVEIVRKWAESQIRFKPGWMGNQIDTDYIDIDFTALTSTDENKVDEEIKRVNKRLTSVTMHYGYIIKELSQEVEWNVEVGDDESAGGRISAYLEAIGKYATGKVGAIIEGTGIALGWEMWDIGEPYLTTLTQLMLHTVVFDRIVSQQSQFKEISELMT